MEEAPLLSTVLAPNQRRHLMSRRGAGLIGLAAFIAAAAWTSQQRGSSGVTGAGAASILAGDLPPSPSVTSEYSSSAAAGGAHSVLPLPYLNNLTLSKEQGDEVNPHVLLLLIDDMGYNDMGYLSTDLSAATPVMDKMAAQGVKLTRYYTSPSCTVARSSLLSGMYASNVGMGYDLMGKFSITSSYGLPTAHKTIADAFKENGYSTHMVGKWNVGQAREIYWPHRRGFDTFLGYMGDEETYFSHQAYSTSHYTFCDLSEANATTGIHVGNCEGGRYSTDLYGDRLEAIIDEARRAGTLSSSPLFLYWASQAVHAPLELPPEVDETLIGESQREMFKELERTHVLWEKRGTFARMLMRLDSKFGEVVDNLYSAGALQNSVIAVASDNGACPSDGGNNWPYRGTKFSSYEGGVHVPAFLWSTRIPAKRRGDSFDGLFHVTDWFPTLLWAGTNSTADVGGMDGTNQWLLLQGEESVAADSVGRDAVLLHLNLWKEDYDRQAPLLERWKLKVTNFSSAQGAIIVGDFKYVQNQVEQVAYNPDMNSSSCTCVDATFTEFGSRALFNLAEDPRETHNLHSDMPVLARRMSDALEVQYYHAVSIASAWVPSTSDAAYEFWTNYDYFVGPWLGNSTYASNVVSLLAGQLINSTSSDVSGTDDLLAHR